MMLKFLLLGCFLIVSGFGLETTKTLHSELHEFQLNKSAGVMAALDMMPKECKKNGKTFKTGEEFEFGNLRYKCQNYGVYSIEGCKTKDGKVLNLGDSVVIDNIKHQCLSHGSSVYYRETTCGILGQPECDKVPLPTKLEEAKKKDAGKMETTPEGTTKIGGVELPKGWRLVDGGSKKINGTNASVVTQILTFTPISQKRVKRQGFGQKGVGRVIGVEDMSGGDSGRPQMPLSMLMNGGKSPSSSSSSTPHSKSKVIGTQHVGADLHLMKSGDKHDTGLVDLHDRHDQKTSGADKFKPGSMSGHKSSVDWKGKTINVNGKSIGAGPGTFSFGNRLTGGGTFLKKDD